MLAARAGSPIGVDAQVLFIDVEINVLFHLRIDVDRRERCMATLVGVKWRDADKAMHTRFGLHLAIGVVPGNSEGNGFNACFLSGLIVDDLPAKSALLRPAKVHSHEHLS